MKNIKGFTLSEVLVTLGVLSVLAAIIIPAVVKIGPDNNRVMFKKAYSTVEKVVSSLISSDADYPADQTGTTTDTSVVVSRGFNYTTLGTNVPVGNNKFCYLFSDQLNTVSFNCTAATVGGVPAYTMTTTDGMVWTFTASTFDLDADKYLTDNVLAVDINGTKIPNCDYSTCAAGKSPDQFKFRIRYDGKMSMDPSDTFAVGVLTNPTENRKQ
jgi:prepilin-type N-terminal cleavage/methylation domain-containing protein